MQGPTVTAKTTNDDRAACFSHWPNLHAVALLDQKKPVALINRAQFMNEYSKLYYREVWGRKSCDIHANFQPRLIEREHCVDELVGILTSQDQRYLTDGFIGTGSGRYVGLGTGDQLVRCVACYADLNNFKPFNDYCGYWRARSLFDWRRGDRR